MKASEASTNTNSKCKRSPIEQLKQFPEFNMKSRRPMTITRVRKAASMLLFSAGTNKEVKRGVRAMRDLMIAGIRIELKYRRKHRRIAYTRAQIRLFRANMPLNEVHARPN